MRISQLEDRHVALWGWGREGRAAWRAIRARLPTLPLTLFCAADEIADAQGQSDALLDVQGPASGAALAMFDVIVKSPGISPLGAEAIAAVAGGAQLLGGTGLWFAEHPEARTVCVTGTKGKSTTTALIAHLLRAGGHLTALAGNIGLPLLELLDPPQLPEAWAIELSSYQTTDVAVSGVRPTVAVVTNIHPEHLDWHGSEARYIRDKLALLIDARPYVVVLDALDPSLSALELPDSDVRWFNRSDGWHLRDRAVHRGNAWVVDAADLPLPGAHNARNLCAALAAIEALGYDAVSLAPHARSFQPLPHRLQALGTRDGIAWVDDSISTTPHATLAALAQYRDVRVALLVGGYDRGLDWSAFADAMAAHAPALIVTMAQNGPRIHARLQAVAASGAFVLREAVDLASAVAVARNALAGGGALLLSPGAPSFGAFRDYAARGRAFAALGGFDATALGDIEGLGIF